jgi:hypothetical protein
MGERESIERKIGKALYHVIPIEKETQAFQDISRDFSSQFELISIFKIENSLLSLQYSARKTALNFLRDGDANEDVGYHTTRGDLHSICQNGLDTRYGLQSAYFGQGIYTTKDPMKANDFCGVKGDPTALRAMFRVSFLKGKTKEFPTGKFEKFSREPEGFDSVTGLISRSQEYVF